MRTVFINTDRATQKPDAKETLGILTVSDNPFTAKTLELPWRNNESQVSCIPAGEYICKWTRSPLFSQKATVKARSINANAPAVDVFTYEIQNVPGRAGIRIHAGVYFFHYMGCIGLGSSLKDLNIDQQLDLVHSGDTCKAFNELMNKEDFKLILK